VFKRIGYDTQKAFYMLASEDKLLGDTGDTRFFSNGYSLSMYPSESVKLNYDLDAFFPNDTTVTFESSNEKIVKISDTGVVTAVGEGFVEIVEQSAEHESATIDVVRRVVEPLLAAGVDKIVLGCTHYPFLLPVIREVVGDRDVDIIDSGEAVERRVEQLLDEYGLRASADHKPEYHFLTFADEEYAECLKRKAFGEKSDELKR
jgi:glutamate racemase